MEGQRMTLTLEDISALKTDNVLLQARLRGTEILSRTVDEREEECVLLRQQISQMMDAVCRVENQLEALSGTVRDATGEKGLERAHDVALYGSPLSRPSNRIDGDESDTSSVASDLDMDISSYRSRLLQLQSQNEVLRERNLSLRQTLRSVHNRDVERSSASGDEAPSDRLERAEKMAKARLALCEALSRKVHAYYVRIKKLEGELVDQAQTRAYLAELEETVMRLKEEVTSQKENTEQLKSMNISWQQYSKEQGDKATALEKEMQQAHLERTFEQQKLKEKVSKAERDLAAEKLRHNMTQKRLEKLQKGGKTAQHKPEMDNRQVEEMASVKSQNQNQPRKSLVAVEKPNQSSSSNQKVQAAKFPDNRVTHTKHNTMNTVHCGTVHAQQDGDLVARGMPVAQPAAAATMDTTSFTPAEDSFWRVPEIAFFGNEQDRGPSASTPVRCSSCDYQFHKCYIVEHTGCCTGHVDTDAARLAASINTRCSTCREVVPLDQCSEPVGESKQSSRHSSKAIAEKEKQLQCKNCGEVMPSSRYVEHAGNCG